MRAIPQSWEAYFNVTQGLLVFDRIQSRHSNGVSGPYQSICSAIAKYVDFICRGGRDIERIVVGIAVPIQPLELAQGYVQRISTSVQKHSERIASNRIKLKAIGA